MPDEESQLLENARNGREAAFMALYQRYRTPVYRFAWRLTRSVETAEDVTQECFIALLSGARFDARQGTLRGYLFGVARHIAFRRMRIDGREALEAGDAPEAADPGGVLDSLLREERAQAVADAISMLPPLQREALILFEYEELSLEEIAQAAGVEIGAVKARLHRGREALRSRLQPLLAPRTERSCH